MVGGCKLGYITLEGPKDKLSFNENLIYLLHPPGPHQGNIIEGDPLLFNSEG